MILYFDGGAKPNPGIMECGVVIKGNPDERFHQRLSYGTNNMAEWTALLWAIEIAISRGETEVTIYGDSKLVVYQANGEWKIKQKDFLPFKEEFDRLSQSIKIDLRHVLRDKNLAGQFLEFG